MTTKRSKGRLSELPALGILLAVSLVLGILADQAVRTVLNSRWNTAGSIGSKPAGSAESAPWVQRDSLLAGAVLGYRDPFRNPSFGVPERSMGGESNGPTHKRETPVVRALFYDSVNPTVQIGMGNETSGWLHTGDQYQGWTVVEISSTSVRITRNGESIVLPSS